jgi:serpin B
MASKVKAKSRRKALKTKAKKVKVVRRSKVTRVRRPVVAAPEVINQVVVPSRIGNNEFTLDIARRMPKNGNYFVSPFNIRTALAMLYAGARTKTAGEMAKVLGFPEEQKFPFSFPNFKEKLEATGVLKMANSIWVDAGQPVELLFTKLMEQMYRAKMGVVDFEGNPEGCRTAINQWVEEQTAQRIKDLMQPQSVTAQTRMVLVSAIYFKDAWEKWFDPRNTRDEDFFSPGGPVKVSFMNATSDFGFVKGPGFRALEMPYKSGLSMFVILPETNDGLPALENDLLSGKLILPRELGHPEVRVMFPKFKVEYGFPVADMLKEMGMSLAFSDDADFSGISKGGDALKVDSVTHKAFCEVNEEGTEAAAATAIGTVRCMNFTPEPQPEIFRADHPFLYMIRENVEGNILFMGRMENPKG